MIIKHRYTGKTLFYGKTSVFKSDHRKLNLRGADLRGARLQGMNFSGMGLEHVDFTNAHLEDANFEGSCLDSACFRRATVSGANFTDADLEDADFFTADARGANFENASCIDANFMWAWLTKAKFKNVWKLNTAMFLLANWGRVSDQLTTELMRYDAANHPDPELFKAWADGGHCPYSSREVTRVAKFAEAEGLYKPGKSKSAYELMQMVVKECCDSGEKED